MAKRNNGKRSTTAVAEPQDAPVAAPAEESAPESTVTESGAVVPPTVANLAAAAGTNGAKPAPMSLDDVPGDTLEAKLEHLRATIKVAKSQSVESAVAESRKTLETAIRTAIETVILPDGFAIRSVRLAYSAKRFDFTMTVKRGDSAEESAEETTETKTETAA